MDGNASPPLTPDGHHVVIGGRRWRATDPAVPEDASARLRAHLMAARRAVAAQAGPGTVTAYARAWTAWTAWMTALEAVGQR
ncbi:hypothetical protein [Streptomyces vinaceus]|uniref:hypothetical protein n=1 Tax=Streptomyces vinaceus TaxID=1960 RepID=UPI0036C57C4E